MFKVYKLVKEYFFTACMCVSFKIPNPNICFVNLRSKCGLKKVNEEKVWFFDVLFLWCFLTTKLKFIVEGYINEYWLQKQAESLYIFTFSIADKWSCISE